MSANNSLLKKRLKEKISKEANDYFSTSELELLIKESTDNNYSLENCTFAIVQGGDNIYLHIHLVTSSAIIFYKYGDDKFEKRYVPFRSIKEIKYTYTKKSIYIRLILLYQSGQDIYLSLSNEEKEKKSVNELISNLENKII